MKAILIGGAVLVGVFLFVIILLGIIRTMQVQHNPLQKIFLSGHVPQMLLNGLYKGSVNLKTSWQGKKFNAATKSGINLFETSGKKTENYPFKLYVGKGAQDKMLDVIKIDYSGNKHPWWLRFVLDEVIEVKNGKLLGKVHLTIIPGLPFTVGFFELKKN